MGLRATVVVRLVVNADKFTQGKLVLSYQPINRNFIERRTDFKHISQLPHVDFDLNTDTEVVLRIPHRGPYTHFDIANKLLDPGVFRVTQYLRHRGNPYTYTVYASFEDIDLLGPTAINTVAYEGDLEIEEEHKPISSKLSQLSKAATAFAMVPPLSSFMAPLAWATGVASNVVSAFGYSRPTTTITPTVYLQRAVAKLNQSDGTDYADPLALTTTNQVQVSDKVGLTEVDEMSFAYLHGMKAALFRFSLTTTTPQGTLIVSVPLCPFAMRAQSDVTLADIMHPMAYTANVFQKYRGSIGMTIDFAKTVFHSARLLVVFEPVNPDDPGGVTRAPRVATIADAINCHKDIIDIRAGNAFTLKFPFTSFVPFLDCERPYGYVHIFVLNSLVTEAQSVPGTVEVGMKFHALEDMEFHGPSRPRYLPYLPSDATDTATPVEINSLVYESGLEVGDAVILDKMVGATVMPTPTVDLAAYCTGEKILSMKQVAMRSKLVRAVTGTQPLNDPVDPFASDAFLDVAFGPVSEFQRQFDWFSYVSRMYAYARGGVVYTVYNRALDQAINFGVVVDPITSNRVSSGNPYQEYYLNHIVLPGKVDRVYVPMYGGSYVRYNQNTLSTYPGLNQGLGITGQTAFSQVRLFVTSLNDGSVTGSYKLYRSAAEDTQFGGFAGVPYVVPTTPFEGIGLDDFKRNSFKFPPS